MHGLDAVETEIPAVPAAEAAGALERLLSGINRVIVIVSSVALVIASGVLTYSVASRYFLHFSTDWQDELSVFLIVGAVFMSAAAIQARRGHVAIEAIVGLLPPRVNRVRQWLVDLASLVFCGYFAWKSWILLDEAWVENFHSGSTCNFCCRWPSRCGGGRPHDHAVDRPPLWRRDAARDVRRHADRVCARRRRDHLHDRVHACILGGYDHAERLRGDGADHAVVDPAVHPQGLRDRTLAGRAGSLRGVPCLDASHPRRARHRQCLRLRAVRCDGRLLAR